MRETVSATSVQAEAFVALVGSPNSGKTTLFNWLTGSRFKTVNYPGATVDYSIGRTHDRYGSEAVQIMDTPGTYSLDPKSPDERVTHDAIFSHRVHGAASVVVAVADATHLARQLLVTRQLIESGFSVVLAVTMSDLLSERRETLDVDSLSKELGIPVVLINGRLGGGVDRLVDAIRYQLSGAGARPKAAKMERWTDERVEAMLAVNSAIVARALLPQVVMRPEAPGKLTTARERTRRIDRVLLHPVLGLVIFIALMTLLFSSIFWAAAPAMDAVDAGFSWLAETVRAFGEDNLAIDFLSNGVIASAGAVLVFVPQIFILFLGITLFEDSGYLARSATLIDKPLSKLGLGGRSFVPMLSGYACAIPAMMAARSINSKRERWLTLFILPLMSCSARLPVYALLLAFLFHGKPAWYAGLALAGIYILSLIVGGIAALIAGRFLKIDDRSFFMMELPVYRRPRAPLVLRQALTRTLAYIKRAGVPIFTFALIMWIAVTFPNFREKDDTARLSSSFAAQAGHVIQPIFTPMGGDWRTGVGLMSAFAARETFVSSLAVVFQVASNDDDATLKDSLIARMQEAQAPDGGPLFTISSVIGLIVFFMIALQCLATVAIAARESGGWKFALVQLAIFNAVAYVLSVGLVQGLRALGVA
jgi:ferrous iron transport protein B